MEGSRELGLLRRTANGARIRAHHWAETHTISPRALRLSCRGPLRRHHLRGVDVGGTSRMLFGGPFPPMSMSRLPSAHEVLETSGQGIAPLHV